jgi:hypothetical protein
MVLEMTLALIVLVVIVVTLVRVWRFRNICAIAILRRSSSESSGSYWWFCGTSSSLVELISGCSPSESSSSVCSFVCTLLAPIPVAVGRPLLCSRHSKRISLFPSRGVGAPDADEEAALSPCPCAPASKHSSICTPGVSGLAPRGRYSVGGPCGGKLWAQTNQQSSPRGHGLLFLMNLHPFIFGLSRFPPFPPPLTFPLGDCPMAEESESCPLVGDLIICLLTNVSGICLRSSPTSNLCSLLQLVFSHAPETKYQHTPLATLRASA